MHSATQSIIQNLIKVPEDKIPPEYSTPQWIRAYVFANYGYLNGLISHIMFILIFAILGVTSLAVFNILSVSLWLIAIVLFRKGYFWHSYITIGFEIIAHAAVCTAIIGWETGFQYYVLAQIACIFLTPYRTVAKVIIAVIFATSYAAMNYYASLYPPYIKLTPLFVNIFNYGNIFCFSAVLGLCCHYFYLAVIDAEKRVEQGHQRTTDALVERNQALSRLNKELAEAAEYVRTILPQPITEGDIRTDWRFVPSTSLGGDAFGYHWLDEDDFAIYLIDVSGHGVGAALLSVSVMNVLRSQSLTNTDFKNPQQVLESLNIAFPSEENNDMFFTIWYGVYNRNTRELTYASGGHPPALLFVDSDKIESSLISLRTPSYVIGGMPDSKFEKRKYNVDKNSTLYIFSDGVYEVEKKDGSMWRLKEFSDFMDNIKTQGQSKLDCLYRYAIDLGKSEHLEDDFTIVEVALG